MTIRGSEVRERQVEREETTRQMPPRSKREDFGCDDTCPIWDAEGELFAHGEMLLVSSHESPSDFYFLQDCASDTGGWLLARPSDRAVYEWMQYGVLDDYFRAWAMMAPENLEWLLDLEDHPTSETIPAIVSRTFGFLRHTIGQ